MTIRAEQIADTSWYHVADDHSTDAIYVHSRLMMEVPQ